MEEANNVCQNPDTVIDELKDVDQTTKKIMREMMNDLKTNKYQHPTDQTGGKMKHNGGKTKNNRMRKY
jgi:division protein CdvB (Snf7/Vps24/ESCRT-III family)